MCVVKIAVRLRFPCAPDAIGFRHEKNTFVELNGMAKKDFIVKNPLVHTNRDGIKNQRRRTCERKKYGDFL